MSKSLRKMSESERRAAIARRIDSKSMGLGYWAARDAQARLTKRAADLPKAAACPHGWANKDKCVQCEAAESASR